MEFSKQYQHPKWQEKRLEVLKLKGLKCGECGKNDRMLHVHHPYYRKNAMIWEYEVEELQVVCDDCHKKIHAVIDKIKSSLACLPIDELLYVLGSIDCLWGPAWDNDENYLNGYTDCLSNRKEVLKNIVVREFSRHGQN